MFDNLDLGPVGLIQNMANLNAHLNEMYNKGFIPWVSFTRNQLNQEELLFKQLMEYEPKIQLVVFSIFHTNKFYC